MKNDIPRKEGSIRVSRKGAEPASLRRAGRKDAINTNVLCVNSHVSLLRLCVKSLREIFA
jgi:hypothetical protein